MRLKLTVELQCKCKNTRAVKAGFTGGKTKKQRYECTGCKKRFVPGAKQKKFKPGKKELAILLYLEGLGMRSTGRIIGCSHTAVQKWIEKKAVNTRLTLPRRAAIIEIDELYYYVKKKGRKRWLWLAICRDSKRILGFQQGSRSRRTLSELKRRIKSIECKQYYTDQHISFKGLLPKKKYKADKRETYTVEGINSVLRHFLARFRRRTKCYSKSDKMVYYTLHLFMDYYNRRRAAA